MPQVISITRQWQIYLPESIRKKIDLKKPGKAMVSIKGKKIIVEPLKSQILSLAGTLVGRKLKRKIKIDKIRDYIDYSQW